MIDSLVAALRRINRVIALIAGICLVVTVIFVLLDISLRQFGRSLGGSDEISGYVMAAVASWGMSFALFELAHVRIDLVRLKLQTPGRAFLDLLSILALSGTTVLIAVQTWPVLAKTLERGSRANTALETPLWIPQVLWFSGWVWFAISSSLIALLAIAMLLRGETAKSADLVGTQSEAESQG